MRLCGFRSQVSGAEGCESELCVQRRLTWLILAALTVPLFARAEASDSTNAAFTNIRCTGTQTIKTPRDSPLSDIPLEYVVRFNSTKVVNIEGGIGLSAEDLEQLSNSVTEFSIAVNGQYKQPKTTFVYSIRLKIDRASSSFQYFDETFHDSVQSENTHGFGTCQALRQAF